MKNFKRLGQSMLTALAVMGLLGTAAASATTLEVGGAAQNKAVTIEATLASGGTLVFKDSSGTTIDTCTASELKAATEFPYTNLNPVAATVSTFTLSQCTHTTDVLNKGKLSFTWDTSGTEGSVWWSGVEWTTLSTVFGTDSICKPGFSTKLGTLTGVSSGHATLYAKDTFSCGILGNVTMTGTYTITAPTGLGIVN
jgi:hypothetical protein